MNVLYIGHYTRGCTTYMRGEHLRKILKTDSFVVADIDVVDKTESRITRSLGWRWKVGPHVRKINQHVRNIAGNVSFDVIWVDKGVFIDPDFLARSKAKGSTLVHYTPDTAFYHNRSRLFYRALPIYDHCITTKSFEIDEYHAAGARNVLFCTQGYDPVLHKPYHRPEEKSGVAFIGHNEESREEMIAALLRKGIRVRLAGARWERFVKEFGNDSLEYLGAGLFDERYAKLISGSQIGLGLLSKKFPELHTTRSFEIPACGTLLASEYNAEMGSFYDNEEVLYYKDTQDAVQKIEALISNPSLLRAMTARGHARVTSGGFDYVTILSKVVDQMGLRLNETIAQG